MVPHATDGRVLFAVPWNNYVIVGTTDTQIKKIDVEPKPLKEEVEFILKNAGTYMKSAPTFSDIKSILAGLRPLAAPEKNEKATKEISRHHKVTVSTSGLISILGGKWTTYRKMAEDTVNTARSVAGLQDRECITNNLTIHGYDYSSNWKNPIHFYGTDIEKIENLDSNGNSSISEKFFISKNQIVWSIRNEMAMNLEDVMARRTRSLFLDAKESLRIAPKVIEIMANEMKKNTNWIKNEIANFEKVAKNYIM